MDTDTLAVVSATLSNAIWHALDQNLLTTALFTAERLYQEDFHNADSLHLVSLTHYRAGEYHKAAEIFTAATSDTNPSASSPESLAGSHSSKTSPSVASHPGCLYIYALACLALGEYSKGVVALERSSSVWKNLETKSIPNASTATSARLVLPTAAMIHTALGHLYRAVDADVKAIKSYAMAIRLDPLLWEATEALCHYGIDLKVDNIYAHLSVDIVSDPNSSSESKTSGPPAPPPHFFIDSSSSAESFGQRLNTVNTPVTSNTTFKGGSLRPRSRVGMSPSVTLDSGKSVFGKPISSSDDVDDNGGAIMSISTSTPDPKRTTALNSQLKRTTRLAPTISTTTFNGAPNFHAPLFTTDLKRNIRFADGKQGPISGSKLFPSQNNSSSMAATISAKRTGNNLFSKSSLAAETNDSSSPPIPIEYHQALQYLISLYTYLTSAFLHFSRYECDAALKVLKKLSSAAQKRSPFCLALYARLYFEKVDYIRSLQFFEKLKLADRFRVRDMDYYSTLLWHLRKDYELSYLASDLSNYARNRAQTWCAIGNACSLQHETEAALRCFRRAAQIEQIGAGNVSPGGSGNTGDDDGSIDGIGKGRGSGASRVGGTLGYSGSTGLGFVGGTPGAEGIDGTGSSGGFGGVGTSSGVTIGTSIGNGCGSSRGYAYAYTLQAHEYVSNDAYEHAQDTYRLAIRADKRHYNAWYGLGMVFLRLGDTKMAEVHFRKAAQINPVNVVLMCCIGMVLEKTGRLEEALQQYTRAIQLQQQPEDDDLDMNTMNDIGDDDPMFNGDDDNFEDEENEFEDGTSYQDEDSLMFHHSRGAKSKHKDIRSKSQMYQRSAGLNGMKPSTLASKSKFSYKSLSANNNFTWFGKGSRDDMQGSNFNSSNNDDNKNNGVETTASARVRQGSAMARYKRARLLVKLQRYDVALEELELLTRLAPDEASVHFLLGQVYKLLGYREKAVKAFTVALNLDPKGSQMIEEALQSLGASVSITSAGAGGGRFVVDGSKLSDANNNGVQHFGNQQHVAVGN